MKIFKKSLAVLLCMITVFAMMSIGFTASAATLNPVVSVYVNDVELTNGRYLAVGGTSATTTKPSGGYAYFNKNKLYLNNYTFSLNDNKHTNSYGEKFRIYADNGILTIYFSGVNGLECNAASATSTYDIYCYRGEVELYGNQDAVISLSGKNYSVRATEGVRAEGGTYNLTKGFEAATPIVTTESTIFMRDGVFNLTEYGHHAYGKVTIQSGIHNFNCPNGYALISDKDDIVIEGGTINSKSGGFLTQNNDAAVKISGGRTNITAKTGSYGINTKNFKMTDGYIKATSDYRAVNNAANDSSANIAVTASTNQNGSGAGAYNAANYKDYKYFEAKSDKTYDVTIDTGLGATTTKAYHKESIGVEPKNIAGKKFTKWTLNGTSLPANRQETNTYLLFDVSKNSAVTVTANFETDTSVPAGGKNITVINGTANVSKAVTGALVTIKADELDGKMFNHWEVTNATIEDDKAEETYITVGNGDVTAEAIYDDCECKCHTGNFFFKIILFFQKLFGMNKVCACGMKH